MDHEEEFRPLAFKSVFAATLGAQFFESGQGRKRLIRVRVEPHHCNTAGFAHGAFLLAVADFTLSHGTFEVGDLPARITLQLSADFMRPVSQGEWLEIEIDVKKSSPGLAFADCLMRTGDRIVLRASGVFKPLRAPP